MINRKKRIMLILCILVFIVKIDIVNGEGSNASTNTALTQSCDPNVQWCWSGVADGLRITFYDSNGNKISNSLDFFKPNSPLSKEVHSYSPSGNKNSKYDYSKEKIKITSYKNWNSESIDNFSSGKLNIIKNLYDYKSNNFFQDVMGISNFSDIVTKLGDYEDDFFEDSDIKFHTIKNKTYFYYMIVEPTTILVYKNENYYGTYAELQTIYASEPANFSFINSLFKETQYHLAKAIYLNDTKIDGNGAIPKYLNKIKTNDSVKELDNKYGIGVFWLGQDSKDECYPGSTNPKWYDETKSCNPPQTENLKYDAFPTCTAKSDVEPCNDRIDYQYSNCTLDNDDSNYIKYEDVDICKISCDERYYISTYQLVSSFNPVGYINGNYENYILAGKYSPISGPIVYHKKTCNYIENLGNLNNKIKEKYSKHNTNESNYEGGCVFQHWHSSTSCTTLEDGTESCTTNRWSTWDPEPDGSKCRNYWTAKEDDYKNRCSSLQTKLKNMANAKDSSGNSNDSSDDIRDQQSAKLELIPLIVGSDPNANNYNSKYEMSFDKNEVTYEDFKQYGFDYGYKNTYIYKLEPNKNRYISMINGIDGISNNTKSTQYIDLKVENITTPIRLAAGTYYNNIDYSDVFSDSFKSIITNSKIYSTNESRSEAIIGNKNIDLDINVNNNRCPYNIKQRNITNYCIPKSENNYCDNIYDRPKINLIYRPISLNNPFPGKNGLGRIAGPNWTGNDIKLYITNNRGISDEQSPESIYQKNAIYKIELDSNKIKRIREYNKTHAYDDFTLECSENTGEECLSTFLRNNQYVELDGTCGNVELNNRSNFYSCADK